MDCRASLAMTERMDCRGAWATALRSGRMDCRGAWAAALRSGLKAHRNDGSHPNDVDCFVTA